MVLLRYNRHINDSWVNRYRKRCWVDDRRDQRGDGRGSGDEGLGRRWCFVLRRRHRRDRRYCDRSALRDCGGRLALGLGGRCIIDLNSAGRDDRGGGHRCGGLRSHRANGA